MHFLCFSIVFKLLISQSGLCKEDLKKRFVVGTLLLWRSNRHNGNFEKKKKEKKKGESGEKARKKEI